MREADKAGDAEAVRALAKLLQEGASKDQINAAAADKGLQLNQEQLDANIASRDAGGPVNTVLPPEEPSFASQAAKGLAQGVGDIVQGVGDTVGAFTDPIAALFAEALGYDSGQMQSLGTNAREGVGLPQSEEGVGRTAREFASGGLGFSTMARGLASLPRAASAAPSVTRNALQVLGRTPVRDTVAAGSAGVGFEAGGEVGNALAGPTGEVIGNAVGALGGGIAGYGAANSAFRRAAGARVLNERAQAAEDLDIQQIAADVGGTGMRFASGVARTTLAGIPIAEGAEQASQSAGRAANRIAGRIGSATDDTAAGQAARRGVERFEKSSLERAENLYERIPIEPQADVTLDSTREALNNLTQGFKSNPQLSQLWANNPRLKATLEALTPKDVAGPARKDFMRISYDLTEMQKRYDAMRNSTNATPSQRSRLADQIEELKRELQRAQRSSERLPVGGSLSWEDMKRFRSIVGNIIGQPGVTRDGSDIAQLRRLYGSLSQDMEATARAQGPKAYDAWKRADRYWRGRSSRIESVFATLLGKDGLRSDEQVYKSINRWSQEGGDFNRLARTIRSLPADEANIVRATLVQRMGLANKGQQAGDGTIFSPRKFATEWQGMDRRAKAVLFPNAKHREDLESLARVAEGMKGADEFRNWSGTAQGVNAFVQGSFALANLPVALAVAGAQFGAGKLLASPRFARIVAGSLELPPDKQGRVLSERLGTLAAQEPALAADIGRIDALLKAVNDNPAGRLAAEEQQPEE
jgi:hypothetical protein